MKRTIPFMLAVALATLVGCANNTGKQTRATSEEPYAPAPSNSLDSMDAMQSDSSYAGDSSAGATYEPEPITSDTTDNYAADDSDEVLQPAGARTHIVKKGDTLYTLARQYYSDQSRWRDIYEANKTRLRNPDSLAVGMKLIIP